MFFIRYWHSIENIYKNKRETKNKKNNHKILNTMKKLKLDTVRFSLIKEMLSDFLGSDYEVDVETDTWRNNFWPNICINKKKGCCYMRIYDPSYRKAKAGNLIVKFLTTSDMCNDRQKEVDIMKFNDPLFLENIKRFLSFECIESSEWQKKKSERMFFRLTKAVI